MDETSTPRVTVITATCNGARFLPAAIESILMQSFDDFEYVLVDDASTDASPAIIAAFAARDRRLRCVYNSTNLGPARALNQALAIARGAYVAVLDHDDLALPDRLARQCGFLDANPGVGAVGAQVRVIDSAGAVGMRLDFPGQPAAARWNLLFGASLLHSASMYRRTCLAQSGGYSERHPYLCDYDLLVRLAQVCQITNLPDELACYRRSATQFSVTHRAPQNGQMLLLQYAIQQRWLGLRPDLAVCATLFKWGHGAPPASAMQAAAAMRWLETLFNRYCEVMLLAERDLIEVAQACARRWLQMAHHAYATLRPASRICWRNALQLDPQIMRRPETWALLRRQRQFVQLQRHAGFDNDCAQDETAKLGVTPHKQQRQG